MYCTRVPERPRVEFRPFRFRTQCAFAKHDLINQKRPLQLGYYYSRKKGERAGKRRGRFHRGPLRTRANYRIENVYTTPSAGA